MEPDNSDDSNYFGIWPALVGLLAAAGIIALMFELATGIW